MLIIGRSTFSHPTCPRKEQEELTKPQAVWKMAVGRRESPARVWPSRENRSKRSGSLYATGFHWYVDSYGREEKVTKSRPRTELTAIPDQTSTPRIKRISNPLSRRTSRTVARISGVSYGKKIQFVTVKWRGSSLRRSAAVTSAAWSPLCMNTLTISSVA